VLPTTPEQSGFPHAQSIVQSVTHHYGKGKKRNHIVKTDTREWVSSLSVEQTSAARYAQLIRGHWDIENGSHRQRDMLLAEDKQRMRNHNRAHVLATLRQISLWFNKRQQEQERQAGKRKKAMSQQVQSTQRNPDHAIRMIINHL
jgi:predicted transposase YbfD/YdcC